MHHRLHENSQENILIKIHVNFIQAKIVLVLRGFYTESRLGQMKSITELYDFLPVLLSDE